MIECLWGGECGNSGRWLDPFRGVEGVGDFGDGSEDDLGGGRNERDVSEGRHEVLQTRILRLARVRSAHHGQLLFGARSFGKVHFE